MNERIEELESKIDRQEQYSRRNCILIHGIAENNEENKDQQAIDFINDNLDIKVDEIDIDRSYRIGRYDKAKKKARPMTVKFARYNVKGRVFREKWKLKGTGIMTTESLTTKGLASQIVQERNVDLIMFGLMIFKPYNLNLIIFMEIFGMIKFCVFKVKYFFSVLIYLLYSIHTFQKDLIHMYVYFVSFQSVVLHL